MSPKKNPTHITKRTNTMCITEHYTTIHSRLPLWNYRPNSILL